MPRLKSTQSSQIHKPGDLAKLLRRYWWEYEALNKHPSANENDSSEFNALVAETLPRITKTLIGIPALSHEDALAAVEWIKREDDVTNSLAFNSIIDAVRGYVVRSMARDESANVAPLKAAS